MRRRSFLASVGAGSVSLAGCLGPQMPTDAVVRAVQDDQRMDVAVVPYEDFPRAEQQIAQTAVEDKFYHACADFPDALRSFAERFTGTEAAYLAYEQSLYAMWIRIKDTIRAGTASPPDSDPSCGVF